MLENGHTQKFLLIRLMRKKKCNLFELFWVKLRVYLTMVITMTKWSEWMNEWFKDKPQGKEKNEKWIKKTNAIQINNQQKQEHEMFAHLTGSSDPRIHFHFVVSVTCFAVNISIGLLIFENVRGELLLLFCSMAKAWSTKMNSYHLSLISVKPIFYWI